MRNFLTAILWIMAFSEVFSQSPTSDSTFQNNQPRVYVFNSPRSNTAPKPRKNDKQVIKIGIYSILSGDMPLYYERKLGKKTSFEIGVGLTLRNPVSALFSSMEYNNNSDMELDKDREFNLGYSFNAGIRFYPFSVLEELYLMPDFRTRIYNSVYKPSYASYKSTSTASSYNEYVRKNDFKINIGYVTFIDTHITFDSSIGLGIRRRIGSTYQTESIYVPGEGYEYTEGLKKESMYRLAVTAQLKIGYSF